MEVGGPRGRARAGLLGWNPEGNLILSGGISNAMERTCHLWICCSILAMVFITQLVLFLVAFHKFEGGSIGVSTLTNTWKSDLIFGLTNNENVTLSKQEYLDPIAAMFPGTSIGCYCGALSYLMQSHRHGHYGVRKGSCTWSNTFAGCKEVQESPPKTLSSLPGGPKLFAIRVRNTSFSEVYSQINTKGECAEGYRNCGNRSSLSRGICISSGIGYCPMSWFSNSSSQDSQPFKVGNLSLYYSRALGYNPFSDAGVVEEHVCLSRGIQGVSPDRDRYILLKGTTDNCEIDTKVQNMSSVGESELFKSNNFSFAKYTDYEVDNKWRYMIYASRPLEWSPECKTLVPRMLKLKEEFEPMASNMSAATTLFVLTTVLFLVALITVCACIPCSLIKPTVLVSFVLVSLTFLLSLFELYPFLTSAPTLPTIPEKCAQSDVLKMIDSTKFIIAHTSSTFTFFRVNVVFLSRAAFFFCVAGWIGLGVFGGMIWKAVAGQLPQDQGVRIGGREDDEEERLCGCVR